MPSVRGIEVSLVTLSEPDLKCLPEFPHPESSSIGSFRTGEQDDHEQRGWPLPPSRPRTPEAGPMVSVYVPSCPNTKFFFSYNVETPLPSATPDSPEPKYLFFKVFINGRSIVNWGIDLREVTSGAAYRALYGPGKRYQIRERGVTLTQPGIEARYFWFLSEKKLKSVADDGGLIEVQVFRAKARSGRAPNLDSYRSHDKYGIGILSEGLVEKPEENIYFDYHLIDRKDCPYAAFRFHYRSWKNLKQLQLTQGEDSGIPSSSSTGSFGAATTTSSSASSATCVPVTHHRYQEQSKLDPYEESIFDDSDSGGNGTEAGEAHIRRSDSGAGSYFLKSPPQLLPSLSANERLPQPSKVLRDGFSETLSQRPLPERPLPELPELPEPPDDSDARSQTSRHSSLASRAPSITPSLVPYVEGESFISESFEIGVATGILLGPSRDAATSHLSYHHDPLPQWPRQQPSSLALSYQPTSTRDGDPLLPASAYSAKHPDTSVSDYTGSIASTDSCRPPPTMISPGNYVATAESDSESHYYPGRFSSSPIRKQQQRSPQEGAVSPKAKQVLGDELDFSPSFARGGGGTIATTTTNTTTTTTTTTTGTTINSGSTPDSSGGGAASVELTESEWIGGEKNKKDKQDGDQADKGRRREAPVSFLSRLWSPRPGSSRGSRKHGAAPPAASSSGSVGSGVGGKGSSSKSSRAIVGLGGYVPPLEENWI